MKVIVDIDDVLVPWARPVHEACIAKGLNPKGVEWDSWHMWEAYGCSYEEWLEVVVSLMVPDGIYHAEPDLVDAQALRTLHWLGHEIHLVTSRGTGSWPMADEIKTWTAEWKEEWAIPGELHFEKDKGQLAFVMGADAAVDDRYENWLDLHNAIPRGLTYLVDAPHNRTSPVPQSRRVSSFAEFAEKILQEAA